MGKDDKKQMQNFLMESLGMEADILQADVQIVKQQTEVREKSQHNERKDQFVAADWQQIREECIEQEVTKNHTAVKMRESHITHPLKHCRRCKYGGSVE